MPIRRELRGLYPPNWKELSRHVRFDRAKGLCEVCGRPHANLIRCLPDGRWFDPVQQTWRDRRGRRARWPDLLAMIPARTTRVVLAAAHLDHDPGNNRLRNLRSLCQRCHLLHDQPYHRAQRWITFRRRHATGDLFLGFYVPSHTDRDAVATAQGLTQWFHRSASCVPSHPDARKLMITQPSSESSARARGVVRVAHLLSQFDSSST